MKVVVLGSGNIAHYCCSRLEGQQEVELLQVYARNIEAGELLAQRFGVPVVNDWNALDQTADIYIFAVADGAIAPMANAFFETDALLIHCAGSQPTTILETAGRHNGIIWPLYSISKNQESYADDIPLIIDGNSAAAQSKTEYLAKIMSWNVRSLNHAQRKYMHLNAVLVNNFSNHLMAIAEQICKKENMDFDILLPIIRQTASRLDSLSPTESQTGPAKRGDSATMQQQMELLEQHPEWQKIYESLSASITKMYS